MIRTRNKIEAIPQFLCASFYSSFGLNNIKKNLLIDKMENRKHESGTHPASISLIHNIYAFTDKYNKTCYHDYFQLTGWGNNTTFKQFIQMKTNNSPFIKW